MKITVYFEAPAGAHEVAVFFDELIYEACVPALKAKATAWGYVLSESVNQVDELEDKHHPLCTAHDGFGCRCEELEKADLKSKVKELLYEYHAAEIGRLIGFTENEGKLIVREIMLDDWGYTEWMPRNVGNGYALFCHGSEWIDENGDNLLFDTEQEALEYVERLPA
jgi:hypothetical protein